MRDPKSGPGGAGSDARGAGTQKSRGLDVRFTSGADAAVGKRLKEMYDGLTSEPVPDRFLDLLSQLEKAEAPAAKAAPIASDDPTSTRDDDANPGAQR